MEGWGKFDVLDGINEVGWVSINRIGGIRWAGEMDKMGPEGI